MNLFKKHLTTTTFIFLFGILIAACFYPTDILLLEVSLVVSFVMLGFSIFEKYREASVQSEFTPIIYAHNISIEIITILVIWILAVWTSYYVVVQFTTYFISDRLPNLIIGIISGLLIGTALGTLIKRITNHLSNRLLKR